MALVRYLGPDKVFRSHLGPARPQGEPIEMSDEEVAFVSLHCPGHRFESAEVAPVEAVERVRTKPAQARKK